jgi:2'-5' RNA ligase
VTSLMSWLVPAGRDGGRLAATIGRLAAEHGTVAFAPHLTIGGVFDADEQAARRTLAAVVAGVPRFPVTFTGIGHEPVYFRSLYLRAEPSAQLTALHEAARRAWALDVRPYQPHLSLLYSDFPVERKLHIIATIGITLPFTVEIGAAELWAASEHGAAGWRRRHTIPLTGAAAGAR